MKKEKLVDNVREFCTYLGELLHEYLDGHPHVGNVRGKGLFWGVCSLGSSKLNFTLTDK